MLKKRQDKITSDRETANQSREEALAMKAEYEEKLKAANKDKRAYIMMPERQQFIMSRRL